MADVLVLESEPSGHHLWYVSLLLDYLALRRDISTCVVTSVHAASSVEWIEHLAHRRFVTLTYRSRRRWAGKALRYVRAMGSAFIVPEGDSMLLRILGHALGNRFGSAPLFGVLLLMRMHPHPTLGGRLRFAIKVLMLILLRWLEPNISIATLESTQSQQHALAGLLNLSFVPDPVSFRPNDLAGAEWLALHGLDPKRRTYLVAGELSERKSVPEILRAWNRCRPDGAQLVLVGRPSDGVRGVLESFEEVPSIRFIDGYVRDGDFDAWVASADYTFVLHRNEGSSGVLLKCCAAGTGVIAGGADSVVSTFRELGMKGIVVRIDSDDLVDAIHRTCWADSERRPRTDLPGGKAFAQAVTRFLDHRPHGSRSRR